MPNCKRPRTENELLSAEKALLIGSVSQQIDEITLQLVLKRLQGIVEIHKRWHENEGSLSQENDILPRSASKTADEASRAADKAAAMMIEASARAIDREHGRKVKKRLDSVFNTAAESSCQ